MPQDGVSLGSLGNLQSDSAVPTAEELGSLGFVSGVVAAVVSSGSTMAVSWMTDGWYQDDEAVPAGEQFMFGWYGEPTGTGLPAVVLVPYTAYILGHRKRMDGDLIPPLL